MLPDDDYDLELNYRLMNDDKLRNNLSKNVSSYEYGEYEDPYDMEDWDIYSKDENFNFSENE